MTYHTFPLLSFPHFPYTNFALFSTHISSYSPYYHILNLPYFPTFHSLHRPSHTNPLIISYTPSLLITPYIPLSPLPLTTNFLPHFPLFHLFFITLISQRFSHFPTHFPSLRHPSFPLTSPLWRKLRGTDEHLTEIIRISAWGYETLKRSDIFHSWVLLGSVFKFLIYFINSSYR